MGIEKVSRKLDIFQIDSSLSKVKAEILPTLNGYNLCNLNVKSANQKFVLSEAAYGFGLRMETTKSFDPWKNSTRLHDVTSHDTAIFLVATM
jgi:hypothetical protein